MTATTTAPALAALLDLASATAAADGERETRLMLGRAFAGLLARRTTNAIARACTAATRFTLDDLATVIATVEIGPRGDAGRVPEIAAECVAHSEAALARATDFTATF